MSRRSLRRSPKHNTFRRMLYEQLEVRNLLATVSLVPAQSTAVYEGESTVIRVARSGHDPAWNDTLTVTYTVAPVTGSQPTSGSSEDSDFNLAGGTIVIPAGQSTYDIPYENWRDTDIEGDEYFRVTITSAVSSNTSASYTLGTATDDWPIIDYYSELGIADLDQNLVCSCTCTDCERVLVREFVGGGIVTLVTGFLKYASNAVSQQVVTGGDFAYDLVTQMDPLPEKIETKAVFDPDEDFAKVTGPSAMYESDLDADVPYRFSSPILVEDSRESGRYRWNFHVVGHIDPDEQPHVYSYSSYHIFKNFANNEFGGFIHTDIDWLKIHDDNDELSEPEEGAVWFRGDTNAFWFPKVYGLYQREPGELDDSTLVKELDGTFKLTKQTGEVLRFTAEGIMTTRTDRNGNVTSYTYISADSDGLTNEISTITYPGSLTYEFDYTGAYVTSITDPYGRVTNLDNDGKLRSITLPDPDGAGPKTRPVLSFSYSGKLISSYTSWEGDTTSFTYADRMIRTITHPDGGVETVHATLASGMHTLSDGLGTNSNRRPLWETELVSGDYTNEVDATWTFLHTRTGDELRVEDPLGGITDYELNGENLVTERTDPDPDGGGPLSRPVTTYTYSGRKLTGVSLPDSTSRAWTYDANFAQVTSYTNGRGYVTNFTVSSTNGNVTAVSIPSLTITASYTYTTTGIKGLVSQYTDPLSRITNYTYDSHGLVTSITYAAGTNDQVSEMFGYDAYDNPSWSDDALGRRTDYDYDLLDRLVALVLPDPDIGGPLAAPMIVYDYNKNNYLTKITDPLGRITEYDYTSRNDVLEVKQPDPDGAGPASVPTTTFDYDLHRRLEDVTDPLGRITAYGYDPLDRQTGLTLPDPDGGGSLTSPTYAWSYDAIGRTLDATDPLSNEVAYTYALLWREVTSTLPDPDGAGSQTASSVIAEYDGEGNLVSTTDELGRETTYAYDALNRLTSVTLPDPDGGGSLTSPVTQYQYDKASNLRYVIDPLGNTTEYVYDNLNRLVTVLQADPDGGGSLAKPEWHTLYDAVGNVAAQIDAAGRLTKYEYDQLDRLVAVRQVDGAWPAASAITTTQGGTASEVQRVGFTGAYGGSFTLSFSGQTTGTIAYNASAATVLAALEALSNIGSGDVAVTQTVNTFSAKEWQVTFQGALASTNVAQITVNTGGLMPFPGAVQNTDVQGGAVDEVQTVTLASVTGGTFTLRFATEETATIAYNAAAGTVETALEALSGIDNVAVSGNAGGPWTITFQGSLAGQNVPPLGVDSNSLTNANPLSLTTYAYDDASRLTSTTDPLGYVTAYEYDNLDRLIELTQPDPDGGGSLTAPVTTFTYDLVGNRLSLTDPVGNETTWAYDNLNRVTSETNELSEVRTFKYDAVGNLTEKVDRLGRKTVWEYDNRYRNTAEKWYDGSTLVRTLSFTYNAASALTAASDPAASYAYTLDNLGRVTTESQDLAGLTPQLQYVSTYDAASRRTQLQAKIGGTNDFKNTFTYDNVHRLTKLEQQDVSGGNTVADKRIDFAYNAASQVATIDRYADLTTSEHVASTHFTYDGLGRLKKMVHTEGPTAPSSGWGTDPLAGYEYAYDVGSRITSIDSYLDGLTDYDYDNTSQLIGADHTGISDETYTYDENGNRTGGSYDTDPNNQLVTDGTYNYTYDDEGNRLTKTKISNSDKEEYTWDHRNRLTKITFKNSVGTVVKTVDQTYDVYNRWIKRSIDPDGATGSAAAIDTIFSYENGQIVFDFDGSAAADLTNRYLWNEQAVDQILASEAVSSLGSAGSVLWPLTDHLGTARDLATYNTSTDDTAIANHRRYDSYGILVSETNSGIDLLFGYTGRPFDESTGLNNNWHRWFTFHVWMNEDPIGFGGGDSNLKRYVHNRTNSHIDPDGLFELPWKEAHDFAWGNAWAAGKQLVLPGQAMTDEATGYIADAYKVWKNSAPNYSIPQRAYMSWGIVAANIVGVRGVSDMCSERDAVDGHQQSDVERGFDGGSGMIRLVTIAGGGVGLMRGARVSVSQGAQTAKASSAPVLKEPTPSAPTTEIPSSPLPELPLKASSPWRAGRYSGRASDPNAFWDSGKRVFPTLRNSGLKGKALRDAQRTFFTEGLRQGKSPGELRGQAAEAGYTRYCHDGKDYLADPGAESMMQEAINTPSTSDVE